MSYNNRNKDTDPKKPNKMLNHSNSGINVSKLEIHIKIICVTIVTEGGDVFAHHNISRNVACRRGRAKLLVITPFMSQCIYFTMNATLGHRRGCGKPS